MKKILISLLIVGMFLPVFPISATAEAEMATVFNPDTGHRKSVAIGDPHAFDGGYLLEVARVKEVKSDVLGFSVVTDYSKNLSSSMNSTQSTVPVTSVTTKDGVVLTMGVLGSKVFLVIEPGARKEEIVMCTGISGTNWTGCTRGLAFYGTSTASVSANRKTHSSGSTVIMSNTHYVYDELVDKDATETINGVKTFGSIPVLPSTNPTTDNQAARKAYVDGVAIAGGATSTETVAGIGQIATQAEQASSTFVAANPTFLSTKYASSTSASRYAVISETDGKLNQGWLDLTENYSWSGTQAFSATTTLAAITIGHNVFAGVASTTITGGTLPQPVYIATSTEGYGGGVLVCDANVQTALEFTGFALTSGSSGVTVYIQKSGIVAGFTGLTRGAKYYVQDAVGTIGTTIGTYEVLVGTAISDTEILIDKGDWEYMGSEASIDCTIASGGTCNATAVVPDGVKYMVADVQYSKVDSPAEADKKRGELTVFAFGKTTGSIEDGDSVNNRYQKVVLSFNTSTRLLTGTLTTSESATGNMSTTIYYYR